MTHMTESKFPDEIASSLRRNPDGSVRRANKWIGKNLQKPQIEKRSKKQTKPVIWREDEVKIGPVPNWVLSSVALFAIVSAVSTNAQPASKQAVQDALNEMEYKDIFISKCWINFSKDIEPSEQNGWASRYIRFVNLDYFKEFSDREIQQIGQGQRSFYGFETRLDANYPLRPLSFTRFKDWVVSNYPGANWPNVRMSRQRTSLSEIEAYLTQQVPNIDQLNRWVFMTEYGENTQIDQFFQMTWSEREPLQKFLVALKDYANATGCDVEK